MDGNLIAFIILVSLCAISGSALICSLISDGFPKQEGYGNLLIVKHSAESLVTIENNKPPDECRWN
jgi:hypothetical protein